MHDALYMPGRLQDYNLLGVGRPQAGADGGSSASTKEAEDMKRLH